MKTIIYCTFLFFMACSLNIESAYSQEYQSKNYTYGKDVNAFIEMDSKILVALDSTIVSIDNETDEIVPFTPFNMNGWNHLHTMTLDSADNLWVSQIGDYNVAKFYGNQWIGYGGSYNFINKIEFDSKGIMWMSGPGIIKYDGENWMSIDDIDSEYFNLLGTSDLEIDSNDNIYVSGYGLAVFNGVDWTLYNTDNSEIPSDDVNSIALDSESNIWIATGNGLAMFDSINWAIYNTANSSIGRNSLNCVAIDKDDNIWCSSYSENGGVIKFDGEEWEFFNTANSEITSNYITSIYIDSKDNVWCGSDYGGVFKFDGNTWKVFDLGNSGLPSDNVTAIMQDSQNTIWVGTSYGGMAYLTPEANQFTVKNQGLYRGIGYSVSDIAIQNNDTLLVGLSIPIISSIPQGGLYKLNNNSFEQIYSGYYSVNSILCTNNSTWLGSENLIEYNQGVILEYPVPDFLENEITALSIDSNNVLWFSYGDVYYNSAGGIASYDDGNWSFYNSENSPLPSGYINDVVVDAENNKLIGTRNGLYIFNDQWTLLNTKNSKLPSDTINCYTLGNNGEIWIGTSKGVVFIGNNDTIIFNTENTGLLSNTINDIFIDNENKVWIGTDKGLSVLYEKIASSAIPVTHGENISEHINFYPNPVEEVLEIDIEVAAKTSINIDIVSIEGKIIANIASQTYNAGKHHFTWNVNNRLSGNNGFYLLKVTTNNTSYVGKFIIHK